MKRGKTYPRRRNYPAPMGCGGWGRPLTVIDGGTAYDYVSIGWNPVRKAAQADRRRYPKLTGKGTDER